MACCVAAGLSLTCATAATNELSGAEIEGRNIVQHLLAQRPAENFTNTGTLKIRDAKRQRTEVQVELQTLVTETNWQALYFTRGANKDHAASLTIIHTRNRPNEYRLANFSRPAGDTNDCITLPGPQAMIPFAGSDFWLADLGLEFLHWPKQRLLKTEMRKGRWCNVLQSDNPAAGGYSRVISWLDKESGGPILAEGYNRGGKKIKEFSIRSLKKVEGAWQLEEMQISSEETKSRTRLEFDLDKPRQNPKQ